MAVDAQPQHDQVKTAGLFEAAIVLSRVLQRQFMDVLFFDLRWSKNS